jgi:glycosyltransferase involved in cell wall biosynthesis
LEQTDPVLVRVVIPTRNRPESLRRAVASVLEQHSVSFEIVVVDEGSDPPAAEALAPLNPRVRVIRNDSPVGPAGARNRGAAASTAPLLAFLDDDDTWRPEKLVTCLSCFDLHPDAGMVYHLMGDRKDNRDGVCRPVAEPIRRMLVRQPPHLDAVVVRREVHEAVRFDEGFEAAEDLDYLLRIAETSAVIELNRVLADHGVSHRSDIGIPKRINGRLQFRQKHERYFSDRDVSAFHYVRLGHLHRLWGRRVTAAAYFARALRQRPRLAAGWKGVVRLLWY